MGGFAQSNVLPAPPQKGVMYIKNATNYFFVLKETKSKICWRILISTSRIHDINRNREKTIMIQI